MSTKALKKQVLAAVAMVLVAAVALGSSTFAWFAMNTTVTTDQITVTAASPDPFLQIKNTAAEDATYATTVELTKKTSATTLPLTAPKAGITFANVDATNTIDAPAANAGTYMANWYTAISDDATQAITAVSGDSEATTKALIEGYLANMAATKNDAKVNGDLCVIANNITLRNSSNVGAQNLRVKVTTTGADTAGKVDDSYRVMLVTADNEIIVFDSTGALVTKVAETGESLYATGTYSLMTGEDAGFVKLTNNTLAKNATKAIKVFVFFDGTDAAAKSENAVLASALVSSLEFKVDKVTA